MEEVARPKELGGAIVDSGVTATRGHALRDHGNRGRDVILGAGEEPRFAWQRAGVPPATSPAVLPPRPP